MQHNNETMAVTTTNATQNYREQLEQLGEKLEQQLKNLSIQANDTVIYDVPVSVVVVLAILYGTISVLAITGNGLVIFVIAKDKRMQTVTNIFIANLAFADIIIGMFSTPFQFQPALHQRWDFPDFLCNIAPCFKVLSVSVSVFTLTIISIDRYVAVIYPLKAGFSKRYAILSLIFIWGFGIGSSFPEGYFYSVKPKYDVGRNDVVPFCDPTWPTENFGKYYYWYLMAVQYIVPLLVINMSYMRIAYIIWGTKAPGNTLDRDNVRQRTKRKVVKMLIIVVLLFVICWMPLQLYQIIQELRPEINNYKYINVIWFCSNWLAMSNSCYNPFIYGLLNEKFKREYRLLFSNSCCMKSSSSYFNGNEASDDTNNGSKRLTLTFRRARKDYTEKETPLHLTTIRPSNKFSINKHGSNWGGGRGGNGTAYTTFIAVDQREDTAQSSI